MKAQFLITVESGADTRWISADKDSFIEDVQQIVESFARLHTTGSVPAVTVTKLKPPLYLT